MTEAWALDALDLLSLSDLRFSSIASDTRLKRLPRLLFSFACTLSNKMENPVKEISLRRSSGENGEEISDILRIVVES